MDHKDSSGEVHLRERTDSYNRTTIPLVEVKDFLKRKDYRWGNLPSGGCEGGDVKGTQPRWQVSSDAKLVESDAHHERWREWHQAQGICVDFLVRLIRSRGESTGQSASGDYPSSNRELLPHLLLWYGNCTSGTHIGPGELLAQVNNYTNFSLTDQPPDLFFCAAEAVPTADCRQ